MNREIVASVFVKVYIKREGLAEPIMFAFCHADDTYAEVNPGIRASGAITQQRQWREDHMFTNAPMARESLMRVRNSWNEAR